LIGFHVSMTRLGASLARRRSQRKLSICAFANSFTHCNDH
jgi:hypothetical protein